MFEVMSSCDDFAIVQFVLIVRSVCRSRTGCKVHLLSSNCCKTKDKLHFVLLPSLLYVCQVAVTTLLNCCRWLGRYRWIHVTDESLQTDDSLMFRCLQQVNRGRVKQDGLTNGPPTPSSACPGTSGVRKIGEWYDLLTDFSTRAIPLLLLPGLLGMSCWLRVVKCIGW